MQRLAFRFIFILNALIVLSVLMLLGAPAVRAYEGEPVSDVWVDGTGAVITTDPLIAASSNVGGSCDSHTGTLYLKFDIGTMLTDPLANKSISSATLTLTTAEGGSNPVQGTLTLYSTMGDGTFTDAGGAVPAIDAALATATVGPGDPGSGAAIVFPSSAQFVRYAQSQSSASGAYPFADNVVTLVVRYSGCADLSLQTFQDNSATAPRLSLENPNAIELLNVSAENAAPASRLPLMAGIAFLILSAVGALGLAMRRHGA